MKTIEELYNIAEHALDGFEAGCYALEYHDVEEDDGDLKVRFDTISLIVLNEQRAFMRHHTNVFSQA